MNLLQASLLAWLLSLGGMVALAFAMDRHYTQWTGRDEIPPELRGLLRGVGVLLLAGVWGPCGAGWGRSVSGRWAHCWRREECPGLHAGRHAPVRWLRCWG